MNSRPVLPIPGDSFSKIHGTSKHIEKVRREIDELASSNEMVLVRGETGTGKELAAHALHERSVRAHHPLEILHCGANREFTPHIAGFDSDLFGHVAGHYSISTEARQGLAALVGKGTLFLDGLECLPESTQARLCNLFETRSFSPLGQTETQAFEGRIVVTTNADLACCVSQGWLGQELLTLLTLHDILVMPPLRDRPEDIEPICKGFFESRRQSARLSPDAYAWLQGFTWEGNVRQLFGLLKRTLARFGEGLTSKGTLLITKPMLETYWLFSEGPSVLSCHPSPTSTLSPQTELKRMR